MSDTRSKRKKQKRLNIGTGVCLLALFVVGFLFLFEAIQDWVTLNNWDSGNILEYQGNYLYAERKYLRNTNYIFALDNGDTVSTPCEYIVGDNTELKNNSELRFRYLSHKDVFGWGTHTAISIKSMDNGHVFLQEELTKETIKSETLAFFLIGFACTFIAMLPVFFQVVQIILLSPKNHKSHKKRKNKKAE